MTKKDIARRIADRVGIPQSLAQEAVQGVLDDIVDTLVREGRIELRNFGVFEVKQRKARKARNPRTGDKVEVPPKFVVTFKPGKEMEERVRELERQHAAAARAARAKAGHKDPQSAPVAQTAAASMSYDSAAGDS